MKYIIDFESHQGFIQILGVTEFMDKLASPLAFQVRGGARLLQTLQEAVEECMARIKKIDDDFHGDPDCRHAFEAGFIVFRSGDLPVTLITQARRATLIIGARQVGQGAIENLSALHKALKKALARINKS